MQMFVKQEPRVWSFRSLLLLPPFNRTFSLFMFVRSSTSQQGCRVVVAGGFFEKPGEGQGLGRLCRPTAGAHTLQNYALKDTL